MCDPLTIALVALTTATAAGGVYANNKGVSAQDKALREQLVNIEAEAGVTATSEVNDNLRAMRKEQARTRVAAGEAGLQLGSGSIEGILKDSLMQAGLATSATRLNQTRTNSSSTAETNSRLSQLQKDSALGAGLKIGSAAISGYASGKSIQISRTATATAAGRT